MELIALALLNLGIVLYALFRIERIVKRIERSGILEEGAARARPVVPSGLSNGDGSASVVPEVRRPMTSKPRVAVSKSARPTILLVDSDRTARKQFATELSATAEITYADSVSRAVEMIESRRPDVIAVDAGIRDRRGYPFWELVRRHEAWSSIPVIVLDASLVGVIPGGRYGEVDVHPVAAFGKPVMRGALRMARSFVTMSAPDLDRLVSHGSDWLRDNLPNPEDSRFLRKASQVVEAHLSATAFGVKELADELGLSPRQVQRRLTDSTGLSPNAFIRAVRLQYAAQRLRNTDDQVSTIAWEAGFKSISYFAKCFREQYGMTPSTFARAEAEEAA